MLISQRVPPLGASNKGGMAGWGKQAIFELNESIISKTVRDTSIVTINN